MRKLAALVVLGLIAPVFAFAQISPEDTGLGTAAGTAGYDTTSESSQNIGTYLGTYVLEPFLGMLGVVFLILMIYGGILWMTAGGNPESVEKAKRIIIHAILGLIVILLAYSFTQFVFTELTSSPTP